MPIVTSMPNGAISHTPARRSPDSGGRRGVVDGWSPTAVRRHTKWLYSVLADELDGDGWALTLTMGTCPASAEDMHAVRGAFLKRLQRLGLTRSHWIVEWQRRGVPHFHMAVYFPDGSPVRADQIIGHWLACAVGYAAGARGQDATRIQGVTGWLQYLSKHAARGVRHYQRQGKPAGWSSTGRLWGHTGEWPIEDEPVTWWLSDPAYWRYRRLIRAWRLADARSEADPKVRARRIVAARRMLQTRADTPWQHRARSQTRGTSEWLGEDLVLELVALLADDGLDVRQVVRMQSDGSGVTQWLHEPTGELFSAE